MLHPKTPAMGHGAGVLGDEHPARAQPSSAAAAGTALPERSGHCYPTAPQETSKAHLSPGLGFSVVGLFSNKLYRGLSEPSFKQSLNART